MAFHAPVTCTGSNGSATFTGIAPGKYRMRVVASAPGYIQTALRRRVVIPKGPKVLRIAQLTSLMKAWSLMGVM